MFDILRGELNTETLIYLIAFFIAVLFSISIHEFAHGYVAYKQGDITAKSKGRLTLNPFAHFDLFGFITLFLFGFGWAKPVPINTLKFKNYNNGIFLTSVAGIVTNIFVAFFSSAIYVVIGYISVVNGTLGYYVLMFFYYLLNGLIVVNINLAFFNILPIAPLDGFNIVCSMAKTNNKFISFMQKYGTIILIFIVFLASFTNVFQNVSGFVFNTFIKFWRWVF